MVLWGMEVVSILPAPRVVEITLLFCHEGCVGYFKYGKTGLLMRECEKNK